LTTKGEYNAEEWTTILEGPATAGMIVVAAEKGGTLRESIQIAKVYAEAAKEHQRPELLNEIVSAPPQIDRERYSSAEDLRKLGQARILEAAAILGRHASAEEVDAYKAFTMKVAKTAAEAHKEGGFLGIGGKPVSEAEQAALDELAATLGVSAE